MNSEKLFEFTRTITVDLPEKVLSIAVAEPDGRITIVRNAKRAPEAAATAHGAKSEIVQKSAFIVTEKMEEVK